MTEGLTGSPEPEKTHLPRRAAETPDLTNEVSDSRRIDYLHSQIGFLKESPEDSPWAKQAKHQMRQRLGTISSAFDVTTDPDLCEALNDLAGDMGTAGNDLFLITRGDVLPANLDTLLVTNSKASDKAVLHLPATEEFFVTAMSEREARIKAGGSVLLVGGQSGTERQSMGRYLKTSEIQKPEEMVASDYKALIDLRNWAMNTVKERGLPKNKNQSEWTSTDYSVQSRLDAIQECEAYFAQSYGGDIAHHTAPTEVELNAFHRYLGELRDSVLSGAEADDAEMIAVVPGDAVDNWSNELTREIPAVPLDRTRVMPQVLLDQVVAQSAESSERVRLEVGAAAGLGVVAARGVSLVGRAAEAVGAGRAAFQDERRRRESANYDARVTEMIDDLERRLTGLKGQRKLVEGKLSGALADEAMRPVLEAMIPDIDDDIGQLNVQLSNLRGSPEDGLGNAA